MTEFEKVSCKVLGVMFIVLIMIIGLQLSVCRSEIPAPPSDYIDEVDMDNFVYTILPSNSLYHPYPIDNS
jgi:hypothetical protein